MRINVTKCMGTERLVKSENMLILTSSSNFVTQDFAAHLPKKPQDLRVTFIPTAAKVERGDLKWLSDDRKALTDLGFPVTDFTLTGKSIRETKQVLDTTDLVFVAGGNTFFLLQEMNKSGFSQLIKEYVHKGMIYVCSSAGSVVAGPDIGLIDILDEREMAPELSSDEALALTDVVIFPHWGSPYFKDDYVKGAEAVCKTGQKIILLTDDQYLLVEGERYSIESIG